jgi:serine/threonine protein kinase
MSSPFDKYKNVQKILGKGTYGEVYITDIPDTAVKISINDNYKESGVDSAAITEFSILNLLNDLGGHPNILRIKRSYILKKGKKTALILPLAKSILDVEGLTEDITTRKVIMYQLMRGLAYMHSKHVMHLDLKPPNILVFEDGTVKISDFGLSNFITNYDDTESKLMNVMSLWWRAPEIATRYTEYNNLVDVWSMGVILASLIKGEDAFVADSNEQLINQIFALIGFADEKWDGTSTQQYKIFKQKFVDKYNSIQQKDVPSNLMSEFGVKDELELNLLMKMLAWPYKRISALDSLNHPYFDSVRENVEHIYKAPRIEKPNCEHILEQLDIPIGYAPINLTHKKFVKYIEWIINTCSKLNLRSRIVFSSILMFVKYVKLKNLSKVHLEVILLACIIINSKLYQYYSFKLDELSSLIDMDKQKFICKFVKKELDIIRTLNFNLIIPNVTDYYLINTETTNFIIRHPVVKKMCLYLMSIPEIVMKYNSKEILSTVLNYLGFKNNCFTFIIEGTFFDEQDDRLYAGTSLVLKN